MFIHLLIDKQFETTGAFLKPGIFFAFTGFIILLSFAFIGNLLIGIRDKRKNLRRENSEFKFVRHMIKKECVEIRYNEINLTILRDGIHFIADKIIIYFREINREYILVLRTNKGYLVRADFDSHHAESEFSFLCAESEATKEDTDITLDFSSYILYDKKLLDTNTIADDVKLVKA